MLLFGKNAKEAPAGDFQPMRCQTCPSYPVGFESTAVIIIIIIITVNLYNAFLYMSYTSVVSKTKVNSCDGRRSN